MRELSIILCVYNEFERLPSALPELLEDISKKHISSEVIVIDNFSTDGTREWLKLYDEPSVKKIFNKKNLGKGGSIKKGINTSIGKYFIIFDPDLEYSTQSIWDCLKKIKEENCQGVLGSRTMSDDVQYHYSLTSPIVTVNKVLEIRKSILNLQSANTNQQFLFY